MVSEHQGFAAGRSIALRNAPLLGWNIGKQRPDKAMGSGHPLVIIVGDQQPCDGADIAITAQFCAGEEPVLRADASGRRVRTSSSSKR